MDMQALRNQLQEDCNTGMITRSPPLAEQRKLQPRAHGTPRVSLRPRCSRQVTEDEAQAVVRQVRQPHLHRLRPQRVSLTRAQLQCIMASFGSQSTTKAAHLCMSRPHNDATGKADTRRSGSGSGPAELLDPRLLVHVPRCCGAHKAVNFPAAARRHSHSRSPCRWRADSSAEWCKGTCRAMRQNSDRPLFEDFSSGACGRRSHCGALAVVSSAMRTTRC